MIVVLICAGAEWVAARAALAPRDAHRCPYGEYFERRIAGVPLLFLHGGWGKIAAAASTEYAIGRWQPDLLLNLGTCGGLRHRATVGERILVTRTIVYDIEEAMEDAAAAREAYTTTIDLTWLDDRFPITATRAPLLSADRDLVAADVADLIRHEWAVAADWESGAIAYVCRLHGQRALILREVSDVVGPEGDELTGQSALWQQRAKAAMESLLRELEDAVPYLAARIGGVVEAR